MSNLQQYLYIIHQTDKNECNARLGATGVRQLPGGWPCPRQCTTGGHWGQTTSRGWPCPRPVKAVCLYDTRQRSVETRKRATSKHIVKLFFHRRVATPF